METTSNSEIKALQDAIYREKVERARRMSPLEKFEAGQELFEMGCRQMLGDISTQFPDADEKQIDDEMERRVGIAHRLDALALEKSYRG